MAVIDTFLKLLVTQRAEVLVLIPEQIPYLLKSTETIELPMPAVPAALSQRLAAEVTGAEISGNLAGDPPLEGVYRTDEGEEFSYQVSSTGAGCRIELTSITVESVSEGTVAAAAEPDRGPQVPAQSRIENSEAPQIVHLPTASPREHQPDPRVLATLEQGLHADASDIFLSAGKSAQMRVNGAIVALGKDAITDTQILQLVPDGKHEQELEKSGSVDFGVRWPLAGSSHRFRINVFRHANGLAAALRPIRSRIPPLSELSLPRDLVELCSYPSGLVLVTGASGSGKSTTLAALIDHLNRTAAHHIITIEDPIEFEHQNDKSLIHQREVGTSVESFSSGLRAALRENPDVILLGEMRDLPTISAALTAAETGHLVLSTLHTGSATAAVNRIVDVFPGHQQAHIRVQLASSLRAVVAQRLVPSVGQHDRLPVLEKLIVTPGVANSIRDGHEHHMRTAIQTGAEEGMITLERSLAALERRGEITRDTAYRHAQDQQALQKLLD